MKRSWSYFDDRDDPEVERNVGCSQCEDEPSKVSCCEVVCERTRLLGREPCPEKGNPQNSGDSDEDQWPSDFIAAEILLGENQVDRSE